MFDANGVASENVFTMLSGIRERMTSEYYQADGETFPELVVFVILMEIYGGRLMYELLGDAKTAKRECGEGGKLRKLLDEETTLVGECMQDSWWSWNRGSAAVHAGSLGAWLTRWVRM